MENTNQQTKTRHPKRFFKELLSFVLTILIAIALAFILRAFIVESIEVCKTSMLETLQPGDRLIGFKLDYKLREPRRGEICTINMDNGEIYIKRVIGIPGDTLKLENGVLYLNGEAQVEPYIREITEGEFEVTVPDGHVFVMGDNRNESYDSRGFGCVSIERLRARAVLCYWPLDDMGLLTK